MRSRFEQDKGARALPVAGFGAALATLAIAPNVDAAVIDLGAGQSVPFGQMNGELRVTGKSTGQFFFTFYFGIFNQPGRYYGRAVTEGLGGVSSLGTITQFVIANASDQIGPDASFAEAAYFGTDFAGTRYIGWQSYPTGRLGWMKVKFEDKGPMTVLAAAVETDANTPIHVGTGSMGPIPLPGALPLMASGLLALGAAGVRKLRQQRKEMAAASPS